MSHPEHGNYGEFETAVAAAAYAITSKEKGPVNSKKPIEDSRTKAKSKRQESTRKPTDSSRISRWISIKEANEDKRESGKNKDGRVSSTIKPTSPFSGKGNGGKEGTQSSEVETKADAWEKAKMAKIQKRYKSLMATILEWENEKKEKAKRKLKKKERELALKRARALQEHQNEISRIDKIAGGARALAEERRRDEEARARAKAQKMRSRGKAPRKCFCF